MSNTTTTIVNKDTITNAIGKQVIYRTANSGNRMNYTLKEIARISDRFAVCKVIDNTDPRKEKVEKFIETIKKAFEVGCTEKELVETSGWTIKQLREAKEYKAQEVWKTLIFDGIEEIN
jgi:hypothetical protein